MIIFPAIDIKDGKCVRLLKGDFNKITSYEKSPLEQANFFSKKGFKNIHIVDLDGALLGESKNTKIIREIINNVKGINRVVYDISSKPPATIEWE